MNAGILFPPPIDPPSEEDLDWGMDQAELYLDREGYQTQFWQDLYCRAMYARLAGERDYAAEEEIFDLMVVDDILRS